VKLQDLQMSEIYKHKPQVWTTADMHLCWFMLEGCLNATQCTDECRYKRDSTETCTSHASSL